MKTFTTHTPIPMIHTYALGFSVSHATIAQVVEFLISC